MLTLSVLKSSSVAAEEVLVRKQQLRWAAIWSGSWTSSRPCSSSMSASAEGLKGGQVSLELVGGSKSLRFRRVASAWSKRLLSRVASCRGP